MKNILNLLICFMVSVAIWFSFGALSSLYRYARLNAVTQAKHVEYTVHEVNEERYLLKGHYQFDVQQVNFTGQDTIHEEFFRNAWAAEKAIPEYTTRKWHVWYSPSNPQYSSLQKTFPLKECVSAVLLWGVIAYFFGLKSYMKKVG